MSDEGGPSSIVNRHWHRPATCEPFVPATCKPFVPALQALAMCLLYQMSLGDDSFFAPYLRTLPYPATLRDWSPEELAEVDPYVRHRGYARRPSGSDSSVADPVVIASHLYLHLLSPALTYLAGLF